jgi:hypothetical protein
MIENLLNKTREILRLNPKSSQDDHIKISIGTENNRLIISLDKKVSVITFDKEQLTKFLAALATNMGSLT